jgi:hypothetical protein
MKTAGQTRRFHRLPQLSSNSVVCLNVARCRPHALGKLFLYIGFGPFLWTPIGKNDHAVYCVSSGFQQCKSVFTLTYILAPMNMMRGQPTKEERPRLTCTSTSCYCPVFQSGFFLSFSRTLTVGHAYISLVSCGTKISLVLVLYIISV